MRFMIIRKADTETESDADFSPSAELIRDMTDYNEALLNAGVLRGGDGLFPSSHGARVSFSNGKPNITDGPFAEAKELIAGYTLIEVASLEEAKAWARKWPVLDGHGNVQLELRRVYTAEDFEGKMDLETSLREKRIFEEAAKLVDAS